MQHYICYVRVTSVRVRALLLSKLLLLPHQFNGLFSRTTWVSRYQKGETSLGLNEVRDDGVSGCSGISWTICNQSAPRCRQIITPTHTHTHTLTHTRLTALCPGLPGWAGTRKVKLIWILLKQETVSGSGISGAVCKSAPRSRQITMPAPHHSVFLQAGCPSCRPTNSVKALKAIGCVGHTAVIKISACNWLSPGLLGNSCQPLVCHWIAWNAAVLPCNNMLARYCVCHKSVLCRNCWTNQAAFWHGSFLRPILQYVVRYFKYSKNKGTKLWTCARASWSFYQQTHQQLTLLTTPGMVDARHCTQFVTRRLTVML